MLYTLENFNVFRDFAHNASVSAGWWKGSERYPGVTSSGHVRIADDDRYVIGTKFALIHSEIAEAYEGYMSGANDHHLPQYPNALVEFGDIMLRVGDTAGYLEIDMTSAIAMVLQADHLDVLVDTPHWAPSIPQFNAEVCFNRLHVFTAGAMEGFRKTGKRDDVIPALSALDAGLARVVILTDMIARKNGWDLPAATLAKREYNAIRPDHKAEVRAIDGGKAF